MHHHHQAVSRQRDSIKVERVRNTLHKSEILRGHSAFSNILKNGVHAQNLMLSCYFQKHQKESEQPSVRVGFAVPRKQIPLAVDRNRVRRLLREVFRKNKARLCETASEKNIQIEVVVVFRKTENIEVRRIAYNEIESEFNAVVSKMISMI